MSYKEVMRASTGTSARYCRSCCRESRLLDGFICGTSRRLVASSKSPCTPISWFSPEDGFHKVHSILQQVGEKLWRLWRLVLWEAYISNSLICCLQTSLHHCVHVQLLGHSHVQIVLAYWRRKPRIEWNFRDSTTVFVFISPYCADMPVD